jgi:hypothetical protein
VVNQKKEPLERLQVKLKPLIGNKIIAFTQTAKDGRFELEKTIHPDSVELEYSLMGYAPQTHKIPAENKPLIVEMVVEELHLKEVLISPQKIMQRGDTIRYLVSAFSAANDRTIGDVLKKMPGVEVLESGEIKYLGQSLNKFYVEGSDLLEGRYGLATNNISYKDVSSIEIMENHQPVKALQDLVFSGSPALNIKLKEDAKSRWAGTFKGGAGIPELWMAETFAMRFKAQMQSLNTYKGNNTGNENLETNMFSYIGDFVSNTDNQLSPYIRIAATTASDIGSSRSTFNQTNTITSNNLFKVGKDFDLVSELTGSLDRRESEFISQVTHFLGDDQIVMEDKTEEALNLKKALTGKLQLKSNQKKFYFNDNLKFNYDRNDPSIDISGSYPNRQKAGIENLKISNDFDILQRIGEKYITFRSTNEYSVHPQSLTITKNGASPVRQDIDLSSFYSNNSMNYSFDISQVRLETQTRLLYQYKTIENVLDDAQNELNTGKLKLDFSPSMQYNLSDFKINLSAPLFYQTLSFNNEHHTFYGINPRFSVDWLVSYGLKLRASLSHSKDLPDENLFYQGNILNDYRNLSAGYMDYSTGKSTNLSVSAAYKDVIKTLFVDLGITLSKKQRTKISGQDFVGDYILSYYYPSDNKTDMVLISGSLSKGIGLINGIISFYPSFVHSTSSTVRNGLTIPFGSDSYSLRSRITSTLSNWCNLSYEFSYTNSRYQKDGESYFSSNRLSESLKTTFSLLESLQISALFDHYNNQLTSNNYKNFIFSDVSMAYLLGNRWEISCTVRNIFNTTSYSYFIENELSTVYQSYKIRPRNILVSGTYRF